ncbi:LytR/AlgR family response regulator transcription factor [Hyphomonas atlantica corrig.]|uniref:LytR/AlgR family response regulator transcription factor n=1 Tax=Hyphomonas atlantica TaxID=1280948 RepID=UPI002352C92D|nr:LytTR family DNA-binding domain-containing protein [Hyphomonas atlantica]
MEIVSTHPELEADRRADRKTWLYFACFLFASFVVESLSDQHVLLRTDDPYPNLPWLSQASSHGVILALTPFITFMLSRFPLTTEAWKVNLLVHAAATIAFSVVHILAMVAIRKLLSPIIFGIPYEFGLSDVSVWLYEFRKDVLTYTLIAALFWLNRMVEQRALDERGAKRDATDLHRLTLKSGGRSYFVNAPDVISAKAAGNYVEVVTEGREYLARMTLTELSRLLQAAGDRHVRVHRSHLVNLDRVSEIVPTGEGDVTLRLDTGAEVPGSRRYRAQYEDKLAA